MPAPSVWMVRLALVHLVAGSGLGALLLASREMPRLAEVAGGLWGFRNVHLETLLVGFMVQLALGVAYWILPRVGGERPRAWLAVAGAALLNAGVVAAAAGGAWEAEAWAVAGRSAEATAALLFGVHAWPRVRRLRGA